MVAHGCCNMLGASSSKRYGRGSGSATVDSLFSHKPTSDPFLFESDEDGSTNNKSSSPSTKKKPKVRKSFDLNLRNRYLLSS